MKPNPKHFLVMPVLMATAFSTAPKTKAFAQGQAVLPQGTFEQPGINGKPAGWQIQTLEGTTPEGTTLAGDGKNHWVQLRDGAAMLHLLKLPPEWTKLTVSARFKVSNFEKGPEDWHGPRIGLRFLDEKDLVVGDYPSIPEVKGNTDWVTKEVSLDIPARATQLQLAPGMWGSKGLLELDDIIVKGSTASTAAQLVAPVDAALPADEIKKTVTPPEAKTVTSPRVAAPTYKSIPLDGGGWFSGITTHSSGRLYGFGDVFGAFRSDDSGNTWSYLNGNITTNDNFVSGMDVSTGNADLVAFRAPGKLFRSIDGGKNWSSSLTDLDNLEIVRGASPVMFHPANDNDLWMAGKRKDISGSLWRSSDGGATAAKWSKVGGTFFDSRIATSIYVHPDYPNQVWVGATGSLSVSTDGGTSWKEVWNNGGVNNPQGNVPTVAGIVRRSSRGAHAGVGYFTTSIGGYRVTATNWADASTYSTQKTLTSDGGWGPTNASVLADGTFLSGQIGGGTSDPYHHQHVSTDGGLTWPKQLPMSLSSTPRPAWSPAIRPDQTTDYGRDFIVQDPKTPSRWYVTGGLLPALSTDSGKNWKYVPNNSGLAAVMTYKVKFTRSNPNMALIPGGDMCAFVVTDGGVSGNVTAASFRTIRKLMSCHEIMSSDDGKILVAAGTDQEVNKSMIMRSTDSGATWKELDLSKSGLPESKEGITRSAMTPGNPDDFLVVLAGNGYETTPRVYRTTNGGATFSAVVGLPVSMDTGSRYHQEHSFLEVDGVNASTRYFVVRRQGPFYRSTDNGATWSSLNHPSGPLDPNHSWVQSLGVDRATEGKLWAAIGWRGLSTSDDGGVNWREVVGFSHTSCVDAANGQVAVWGKRNVNGVEDQWNKLYWSPDNGVTWTEATGEGHRYAFTREIAVDPWVKGKVWVSGISVNVISGLPGSTPK